MILRRFMQHVKEQNWFAVGLDVIVVIVGIYLGFQVTEWGVEQSNREEEQRILQTLSLEVDNVLARKLAERAENAEEIEEIYQAVDFLESVNTDLEISYTACRRIAVSAGNNWRMVRLNTADEVIASGKLNLIGDEQVRLLIMEYRSVVEENAFRMRDNSRGSITIPSKYPQIIRVNRTRNQISAARSLTFECNGEKMRANLNFQNDFKLNTLRHTMASIRSDEEIEVLERLKVALSEELAP